MPGAASSTNARAAGTIAIGDDLMVHRLGFGAMRLTGGGIWGEPDDPAEAKRVLRRAIELGVDFIDTADSYGPFVSERLIAEALFPYPSALVIATKGGLLRDGPGRWRPDGRPEHLREACEGSLRRLRVDRIDLYQLHRPDPAVPLEESLDALLELQREGRIRYIGICNVTLEQLRLAREIAGVTSVQDRYNLIDRRNRDVLERCTADWIPFLPWFPLAKGDLARAGGPLARIAAHHHATTTQIAIAWLLQSTPVMLPIPGTSSVSHLEENVAAAGLLLEEGEMAELDNAVAGTIPIAS
jgi:aryl-alcohol dehydrogenase-like predicted oxidoreductase